MKFHWIGRSSFSSGNFSSNTSSIIVHNTISLKALNFCKLFKQDNFILFVGFTESYNHFQWNDSEDPFNKAALLKQDEYFSGSSIPSLHEVVWFCWNPVVAPKSYQWDPLWYYEIHWVPWSTWYARAKFLWSNCKPSITRPWSVWF